MGSVEQRPSPEREPSSRYWTTRQQSYFTKLIKLCRLTSRDRVRRLRVALLEQAVGVVEDAFRTVDPNPGV
jgi:hypothetical protein